MSCALLSAILCAAFSYPVRCFQLIWQQPDRDESLDRQLLTRLIVATG